MAPSEARFGTGYWLYGWDNLSQNTVFGRIWGLSDPYMVQKVFSYTKMIVVTWRSAYVIFYLVKKPLVLVKNHPKRLYHWENFPFRTIFRPSWGVFNASVTHIGFKRGSQIHKMIVWTWRSTLVIFNLVKKTIVLVKNDTQRKSHIFCNFLTLYGRWWPLSET